MNNEALSAFSNPTRLKLLCCLSKKSTNVEELIGYCTLSQSAISQHLGKLKKAGLVKTKRRGKFIYYSLSDKKIGEIANQLSQYCIGKYDQ